MALIIFLLILAIPLFILLGLVGITIQGIGALLLFFLKYLLPAFLIGVAAAAIHGRKTRQYKDMSDLGKAGLIGAAAGMGLLLIWMLLFPARVNIPQPEDVSAIAVSYESSDGTVREITQDRSRIHTLCQMFSEGEYRHTITEFRKLDEEEGYALTVEFLDAQGTVSHTYTVLSSQCLQDGLWYYNLKKDSSLDRSALMDVCYANWRQQANEKWQPFVQELFASVYYDDETGDLCFTIPNEIPEHEDSYYRISLTLHGMRGYQEGDEYITHSYEVFSEEQENSSWETGMTYQINEIPDAVWETLTIGFRTSYVEESFDCLPLLPEELLYTGSGSD